MTNYDELLAKLKVAREKEEDDKKYLNGMIETAKLDHEYIRTSEDLTKTIQEITFLNEQIKTLALTEWINTKNKKPHEKIEVKIFKTFKILNADVLREWVFKNLPAALSPDMKKVEKYAMEIGSVDGTEKGEEARVQIASKL